MNFLVMTSACEVCAVCYVKFFAFMCQFNHYWCGRSDLNWHRRLSVQQWKCLLPIWRDYCCRHLFEAKRC